MLFSEYFIIFFLVIHHLVSLGKNECYDQKKFPPFPPPSFPPPPSLSSSSCLYFSNPFLSLLTDMDFVDGIQSTNFTSLLNLCKISSFNHSLSTALKWLLTADLVLPCKSEEILATQTFMTTNPV